MSAPGFHQEGGLLLCVVTYRGGEGGGTDGESADDFGHFKQRGQSKFTTKQQLRPKR